MAAQEENVAAKLADYEKKFQEKDKEIENYKKRVAALEEELSKAQKRILQSVKEAEEVDSLKSESEKTLTKAKSIIFERTKVIKNQELQIEAYNQQIDSLKDVVRITKDLLEIRNLEVKQLEGKINCMEDRMKAEKERQDLMHKKLETMIRHNGELKREYETQLCLFTALRERYNERELARGVIDDLTGTGPNRTAPVVATQQNITNQAPSTTEVVNVSPTAPALNGQENTTNQSPATPEVVSISSSAPVVNIIQSPSATEELVGTAPSSDTPVANGQENVTTQPSVPEQKNIPDPAKAVQVQNEQVDQSSQALIDADQPSTSSEASGGTS